MNKVVKRGVWLLAASVGMMYGGVAKAQETYTVPVELDTYGYVWNDAYQRELYDVVDSANIGMATIQTDFDIELDNTIYVEKWETTDAMPRWNMPAEGCDATYMFSIHGYDVPCNSWTEWENQDNTVLITLPQIPGYTWDGAVASWRFYDYNNDLVEAHDDYSDAVIINATDNSITVRVDLLYNDALYGEDAQLHHNEVYRIFGLSLRKNVGTNNNAQVKSFVSRLYNVALNREPDAAGLADWTNRLTSGQAQAVNIVQGIMCSPEYLNKGKSNGEIVNDCYKAMLGRDADEGGYNDWVTKLDNGMTVNAIFAGFVGSQEFSNLCNNYGIQPGTYAVTDPRDQNQGVTAYVSRLYTQALGRGYDEAGLSDWCGRILVNPSRENIVDVAATGFFHSDEFQNKGLNNEEYVKVLYRTFLGRECDPNGLADWVGQLDRGEKTRDEILPGFANSQEFGNIMAQYGL